MKNQESEFEKWIQDHFWIPCDAVGAIDSGEQSEKLIAMEHFLKTAFLAGQKAATDAMWAKHEGGGK